MTDTPESSAQAAAAAGASQAPHRFEVIDESAFAERLGNVSTEVSSVALGGRIIDCSDEWFAPASDLLKVAPAASMKGQFGPKGALFDGWETRRHNPTYDWVLLRLGPTGGAHITGFDVDTANFNGNEAPEVDVYGLYLSPEEEKAQVTLQESDARWSPLLLRAPCKPSSRHLYAAQSDTDTDASQAKAIDPIYTHIKLHMIPDGGIARFRVYGTIPPPPVGSGTSEQIAEDSKLNVLDLAHVLNGGRVIFTSDQHFGIGPNVLLPGRGKDMGDGWETKRSRTPGHKDCLIIKLGETGFLNYVEIDTAHFLGNFPESVELHATYFDGLHPPDDDSWMQIMSRQKMGPGRQHYFPLDGLDGKPFSHVRVTMHPDGGIKRVRVMGRRVAPLAGHMEPLPPVALPASANLDLPDQPRTLSGIAGAATAALSNLIKSPVTDSPPTVFAPPLPRRKSVPFQHGFLGVRHLSAPSLQRHELRTVQAPPLTPAAFAPYGDVIASPYASGLSEQEHKIANQGTAQKYENVSDIVSSYSAAALAKPRMHIYRCQGFDAHTSFEIKVLERHQFTKQAFMPMSNVGAEPAQEGYLVIVARNGPDDLPDLSTLAAFRASSQQGISYGAGIWHHPMVALGLGTVTDFACVVHDSTVKPELNCDEVFWKDGPAAIVELY